MNFLRVKVFEGKGMLLCKIEMAISTKVRVHGIRFTPPIFNSGKKVRGGRGTRR